MLTTFAAVVRTVRRMVRRVRCCGKHRWIMLDIQTRQCHDCDLVQCRVKNKPYPGRKRYKWVTANTNMRLEERSAAE